MRVERAARSALTLALVSIIIELVVFAAGVLDLMLFNILMRPFPLAGFNLYLNIYSYSLLTGIVWAFLNYFLVYLPLKNNKLEEAEAPTLALGIIELLFGGIIPGILLLIAYVKIGDALDPFLRSE